MLPIILFVILAIAIVPFGYWVYLGSFNGRYERWSQEQFGNDK